MNMLQNEIVQHVNDTFDFSVNKFPLSLPDNIATPWYGLCTSSGEPIGRGSVSGGYKPHQTEDVIALVEATAEAFGSEVQVECSWHAQGSKPGHYVSIAPTREERLKVFGESDNVWPRVVVQALYDGRAFRANLGTYRDACKNLAMLETVSGCSVAIRHDSGLRNKMDDLIEQFQSLRGRWDAMTKAIVLMQSREVNLAEFLNEVYPVPSEDSSRSRTIYENRTAAIFNRVYRERLATGRPEIDTSTWMVSAWEAYNGVQGFTQHKQTRRGNPSDFRRAMLAASDRHVLKAETLAVAA